MKELLIQYASYNNWANQRVSELVLSLSPEKHVMEITGSFPGILKTMLHLWDAESIWWQRLKLQERVIRPSEDFTGNLSEVTTGLLQQSRQWEEWVVAATDLSLDHVFQYQNTKREQFKQPVYQVLLHLFNHSTYHRGQLVNMLRVAGLDKIPPTDFIVWSRKR